MSGHFDHRYDLTEHQISSTCLPDRNLQEYRPILIARMWALLLEPCPLGSCSRTSTYVRESIR